MPSIRRSERLVKPARSVNMIGERLPRAAGLRLDPLRDEGADEIGRDVLAERRQPTRHLEERGREIVDLAQERGDRRDALELEALDMAQLARDAQQRLAEKPVRRQRCGSRR